MSCNHPHLQQTARTDYCPDCEYQFYYGDAHAQGEAQISRLINAGNAMNLLSHEEIEVGWKEMCEKHVQPSVLFKVARHVLECEVCRRAFETYQREPEIEIVHLLYSGVTLCLKTGVPSQWESNHKWVGIHDNLDDVNCPICKMKLEEHDEFRRLSKNQGK